MPCWMKQPWLRDSNEMASGKPGAVQFVLWLAALSLVWTCQVPASHHRGNIAHRERGEEA